jgi:hypothetical protein
MFKISYNILLPKYIIVNIKYELCQQKKIKYKSFKRQKFNRKIKKIMTYESNCELIFCGETFYDILNIPAKNHLKIHIDLTVTRIIFQN